MDSKVKLFYDCYMEDLKRKALILMDYTEIKNESWLYKCKSFLELNIEEDDIYLKYNSSYNDRDDVYIYLDENILLSDNFEEELKKLKKWN